MVNVIWARKVTNGLEVTVCHGCFDVGFAHVSVCVCVFVCTCVCVYERRGRVRETDRYIDKETGHAHEKLCELGE